MRLLISAACLIATLAAPVWAQTPTPQAQPVPRIAEAAPAPLPPSGLRWQRYLRASEVQLQNLAAFVRIRPEDREDVAIAIVNPGPLEAPEVRRSGRRLVIDGRQRGRLQGCTVRGVAGFEVEIGRVGNVGSAQLPIIEIRVPERAVVSARGAMRLHLTRAESVQLAFDACGDAVVERVDDEAEISISHEARLRIFDVGQLEASLAGNAEVVAGYVRDGLTVSIAGPGRFQAARAEGPANFVIQGPGEATVRGGDLQELTVVINGPGRVEHGGSAESLDALIVGGGEVRVRDVDGDVTQRVIAGGDVIIGR
jgi:hypothetical protein